MAEKKLTVVQLLPEMDEGGVEGETLDLAMYLAEQGYRSIVISGGGRLVQQLEKAGCEHVLWPHIGEKSMRCARYLGKLKRFLVDEKVDVLHMRSRLPAWIGYFAWRSLPLAIQPSLVTTFHGFYSVNSYSAIMTKGEKVVAVSETIREHIQQNYSLSRSKISLIHGGFDDVTFNPANVEQERLEKLRQRWLRDYQGHPVIVLPGRLTQWKGQEMFLDSLSLLEGIDFVALLVGDTEENPSYTRKLKEKIRNLGLEDKVILAGHCSDMPAALLLSDIVVSASSSQPEAFGKVAIEAMAMARPVIATAHGGSLETVLDKKTGWLVEPNDPTDMARALEKALADLPQAKKNGEAGRKWVLEQFTARRMCEKTVELYQQAHEEKLQERQGKRLKVLQLLPELHSGGVERGTLELGNYLARQGHGSYVMSGGGRMVEQLTREGSVHLTRNIGAKSPIALWHFFPLRSTILREKINVLHLRSRMPAWLGYAVWKTLPVQKRPILVTTFHGFYSVNAYSAVMTKGEGVIAISKSIQQHISDKYNRQEGVQLIYRGVDGEIFDPARVSAERIEQLKQKWQLPAQGPVIMLPGRLTRLKGQAVFLQSLLQLKTKHYLALLVGDIDDNSAYTKELRDLIERNGLQGRVRMVGHCEDMPAAFMLADLVLSTSSLEPEAFGRTTVEAMAMGKAVIATAHGGSLETVVPGETGWLVKPSDPQELAKAIDEALGMEKGQLAQYGLRGQEVAREKFTAETMCSHTLQFYRHLFSKRIQGGAA